MNKQYAIFDMDGTLVDSMAIWDRFAAEFLTQKGVRKVPPDVLERVKPMTLAESAGFFVHTLGLNLSPERAAAEMNAAMEEHYRRDIPLKRGAAAYLRALGGRGVRMCVASATAEPLMEACLTRLGVRDAFEFLLSCETVGAGKTEPAVYLAAAERLGACPADIAVYEDAVYAVRTAKCAGFYVVGVYDESGEDNWEEIRRLADETIRG